MSRQCTKSGEGQGRPIPRMGVGMVGSAVGWGIQACHAGRQSSSSPHHTRTNSLVYRYVRMLPIGHTGWNVGNGRAKESLHRHTHGGDV